MKLKKSNFKLANYKLQIKKGYCADAKSNVALATKRTT